MKRSYRFGLVLVAIAGFGCSNGGRSAVAGNQCSSDYKPINNAVDASNKVELSPDAGGHVNLKPGQYQYTNADFYFEDADQAPDQNYRVHIKDGWDDKLKTFKATIACVRNAKMGMGQKTLAVSTQGVTSLSVDGDRKLSSDNISVRNYGFKIEADGSMTMNFTPAAEKPSDPSSVHKGGFIYVHPENPDLIEVRSEGKTANGGHWILANRFLRTNQK